MPFLVYTTRVLCARSAYTTEMLLLMMGSCYRKLLVTSHVLQGEGGFPFAPQFTQNLIPIRCCTIRCLTAQLNTKHDG
jgi:hypothetical protein